MARDSFRTPPDRIWVAVDDRYRQPRPLAQRRDPASHQTGTHDAQLPDFEFRGGGVSLLRSPLIPLDQFVDMRCTGIVHNSGGKEGTTGRASLPHTYHFSWLK